MTSHITEHTTTQKETPQPKLGYSVLSIISFTGILASGAITNSDSPNYNTALIVLAASVCIGVYVFLCITEITVGKFLKNFKMTALSWTFIAATLIYLARIQSISDLNTIFHIDSSAFPLTLVAATVLNAVGLFWIPINITLTGAALIFITTLCSDTFDNEFHKASIAIPTLVIFSSLGILALFIKIDILNEKSRYQILYRVAHATDFNGEFRCQGIDHQTSSVIFIGPDQARVLVAPKISDPIIFPEKKAYVLKSVQIPDEFTVRDCIPPIVVEPTNSTNSLFNSFPPN